MSALQVYTVRAGQMLWTSGVCAFFIYLAQYYTASITCRPDNLDRAASIRGLIFFVLLSSTVRLVGLGCDTLEELAFSDVLPAPLGERLVGFAPFVPLETAFALVRRGDSCVSVFPVFRCFDSDRYIGVIVFSEDFFVAFFFLTLLPLDLMVLS